MARLSLLCVAAGSPKASTLPPVLVFSSPPKISMTLSCSIFLRTWPGRGRRFAALGVPLAPPWYHFACRCDRKYYMNRRIEWIIPWTRFILDARLFPKVDLETGRELFFH